MDKTGPFIHHRISAERTCAVDDLLPQGVLAQVRAVYRNEGQVNVWTIRFGREPLNLALGIMRRIRRIDKILDTG